MSLIISRRSGEEFVLFPVQGISAEELMAQMSEGITIRINAAEKGKASIAIDAPKDINILRSELIIRGQEPE